LLVTSEKFQIDCQEFMSFSAAKIIGNMQILNVESHKTHIN